MIPLVLLLSCTPDEKPVEDCTPVVWTLDLDGDGYAGPTTAEACERPAQAADLVGDCDDAEPEVYPGAKERCNGRDDDCDGVLDPDGPTGFADADGDGYGDPATPVSGCAPGAAVVDNDQDCDDTRADVYPGAPETWYDGVDQDCRGDEDFDADGDGHLVPAGGGGDCDDDNALVHPDREEICANGLDDDCDGEAEECVRWGEIPISRADYWIEGDGHYEWMGFRLTMLGRASSVTERPVFAVTEADGSIYPAEGFVRLFALEDDGPVEVGSVTNDEYHDDFGYIVIRHDDLNGDGHVDMSIWSEATEGPDDERGPGRAETFFGPFDREFRLDDAAIHWHGYDHCDMAASSIVGPLVGEGMEGLVAVSVWSLDLPAADGMQYGAGAIFFHAPPFARDIDTRASDTFVYGTRYSNAVGYNMVLPDVDGDGVSDLVTTIGNYDGNSGVARDLRSALVTILGPISGAVSIWDNDGELTNAKTSGIGYTMEIPGDIDGDGVDELVAGAPYYCAHESRCVAGSVWVFRLSDLLDRGKPDDHALVRIDGSISPYDDGRLGDAITHGDFDGDGRPDLLLGARYNEYIGGGSARGIAYGFYTLPRGTVFADTAADFQIRSESDDSLAAWALAGDMDLNGDGCDDILISEPNWPSSSDGYGRVGIFLGGCR